MTSTLDCKIMSCYEIVSQIVVESTSMVHQRSFGCKVTGVSARALAGSLHNYTSFTDYNGAVLEARDLLTSAQSSFEGTLHHVASQPLV